MSVTTHNSILHPIQSNFKLLLAAVEPVSITALYNPLTISCGKHTNSNDFKVIITNAVHAGHNYS